MDRQRRFWVAASSCCSCVAAGALAVPLLGSLGPSARARAAGAPTVVRFDDLEPGQRRSLLWRGQPIWLLRRSLAMLEGLARNESELVDPGSLREQLPTPVWARNRWRSRLPELLVLRGVCTHLGCIPLLALGTGPGLPRDWPGGFVCPCHGSRFDLAGRVYRNMPAPDNLPVPPYQLIDSGRLLLGADAS